MECSLFAPVITPVAVCLLLGSRKSAKIPSVGPSHPHPNTKNPPPEAPDTVGGDEPLEQHGRTVEIVPGSCQGKARSLAVGGQFKGAP